MSYNWRGRGGFGRGGSGGPPWAGGPWTPPQMPSLPRPPPGATRVAVPVEDNRGLDSTISWRMGRASYIAIVDVVEGRVAGVNVVPNAVAGAPRGAGIALGQWLLSIGVNVVVAPRVGPNIAYVLQQGGVRVEVAPPGSRVRDALRNLGIAC